MLVSACFPCYHFWLLFMVPAHFWPDTWGLSAHSSCDRWPAAPCWQCGWWWHLSELLGVSQKPRLHSVSCRNVVNDYHAPTQSATQKSPSCFCIRISFLTKVCSKLSAAVCAWTMQHFRVEQNRWFYHFLSRFLSNTSFCSIVFVSQRIDSALFVLLKHFSLELNHLPPWQPIPCWCRA